MASSENTIPKKTIPIAQCKFLVRFWSFLESRLLLWQSFHSIMFAKCQVLHRETSEMCIKLDAIFLPSEKDVGIGVIHGVKISSAAYQGRWTELKADEEAIGKCKWSAFGFGHHDRCQEAAKLVIFFNLGVGIAGAVLTKLGGGRAAFLSVYESCQGNKSILLEREKGS